MKKILALLVVTVLLLTALTACGSKSSSITIAVPNDATNEARALLLLQENGYIKLKDGEVCTNFVKVKETEPEIVLVSEAGRFLRFAAADIPEKKRGAGTVAGIAMKDGEKLSDVFFVWPEDVNKKPKEETKDDENVETTNETGLEMVEDNESRTKEKPAAEDETIMKPEELILTLKNKKQSPFSKLAKAKRGGKGTLKKI